MNAFDLWRILVSGVTPPFFGMRMWMIFCKILYEQVLSFSIKPSWATGTPRTMEMGVVFGWHAMRQDRGAMPFSFYRLAHDFGHFLVGCCRKGFHRKTKKRGKC
jgi:hypothetical protein